MRLSSNLINKCQITVDQPTTRHAYTLFFAQRRNHSGMPNQQRQQLTTQSHHRATRQFKHAGQRAQTSNQRTRIDVM